MMTTPAERADGAAVYAQLLETAYPASRALLPPPLSREEQTELWLDARWGRCGDTQQHGALRLIDIGTPNPSRGGPAILRAEIECDGERLRGDIVLHTRAEDWETETCSAPDLYRNTVLHVVLQPPPGTWHTLTADSRDIPVWAVPADRLRAVCGCARLYPAAEHAAQQLKHLSAERTERLLLAAAAYRAEQKAAFFEQKAAVIDAEQAWFEAWAEVLGYALNKRAMRTLARRAPLAALRHGDAEAILLGTAGFLQAVLPEHTTEEARTYHSRVWSAWWQQRERFVPAGTPPLPWELSPVRPMNHPTRRVAALALSARHWDSLFPLMNAAGAARLTDALCDLSHPFWDTHCTLSAAPLRRRCALVGRSRAADFLANVVYPLDGSRAAWATYLTLRAHDVPKKMEAYADALFGKRAELRPMLRRQYVQQALLQIQSDFGG